MTIAALLQHGQATLRHSPAPYNDARLLLSHALDVDHAYLIAHADDTVSQATQTRYDTYLSRAAAGEPVPYLIGRIPFRHLTLRVTPAVLIPRPETEQLVDHVVRWVGARGDLHDLHIADVGTGSGCIAISLALDLPHAAISATDLSAAALAVAQQNAREHSASDICFRHGSLLDPIDRPLDAIVANLPYIRDDEWTQLPHTVKYHEPAQALRGGADGLDLIRALLHQARSRLRNRSAIFLEIGWQQGPDAVALARSIFPEAAVACVQDLAGHDRVISITGVTGYDAAA